jgi:tetrapyrrole methylase family protein/MazG family protein
MGITIVGMGPGDIDHLTRQAWDLLAAADNVYLRTKYHPVVNDLSFLADVQSFDQLYESAINFDELYETIAAEVIAKADAGVVYAVPGHPLVGESSVTAILSHAPAQGIDVQIIPGMSFVEPVLAAVQQDALDGLQIFDAVQIAAFNQPPLNTDVPVLLGQVYNRFVAGTVKISLMALYPDDHEVVLVHAAGTKSQTVEKILLYEIDRSDRLAHLTSLYVPPLPLASSLQSFAETVAYLRGPDGCPWDQEQTRQSLRSDFLEEVAEALDALDNDVPEAIQEELGDILYHLVMQAQIASELGEFTLGDVIAGIESKLRRRHPHVWGDLQVSSTVEVLHNWQQLKKKENEEVDREGSVLRNVPSALPSLARAQEIQNRVRTVGFDWPSVDGVVAKVNEELSELQEEHQKERISAEMGDVLFALVNWARWLDVNAEIALREAIARFVRRFNRMEDIAKRRDRKLTDLNMRELDELWEEAKISLM